MTPALDKLVNQEETMQAISKQELKTMNGQDEKDFILVNVLPNEVFNKDHIRTSINVPVDEDGFEKQVEAVAGSKDRDVVVYCANFECDASPQAAKKLEEAGFTSVYDYEGGTRDWNSH